MPSSTVTHNYGLISKNRSREMRRVNKKMRTDKDYASGYRSQYGTNLNTRRSHLRGSRLKVALILGSIYIFFAHLTTRRPETK